MSDTPPNPTLPLSQLNAVRIELPDGAPDPKVDPAGFQVWAATPAGVEFFRRVNMRLMEERINAEQAAAQG